MKTNTSLAAQETLKMLFKDRIRTNLLRNSEHKALSFLVQRLPSWVFPDLLTFIGFLGSLTVLLSFILATYVNRYFLLLGLAGFFINWFGDSLDGRLAIYRNKSRKWYGFSLDLSVDWITTIVIGLGFVIYTEGVGELLGYGFVVLYGWAMITTLMRYKITGEYTIDSGLLGPTEVRMIISAILLTEVLVKDSLVWVSGVACFILLIVDIHNLLRLLKVAADKDEREKQKMPEETSTAIENLTYTGKIRPAEHITHQHIAAVINTLIPERIQNHTSEPVRILDLGCGDGKLLSHLISSLSLLRSSLVFDVFGLDVTDAGQQDRGFMDHTISRLSKEHPSVSWEDRLTMITTQQKWPHPSEYFDFIVSNQVMEHVMDHDFVLSEIARCLKPGGISIHLFPVREVLWEGHALMPLVHRIRDIDRRARFMYFFARLGFKRHYYREKNRRGWKSLREFATVFAHILEVDTNYITTKQLRDASDRAGLTISFSYTKDLYSAKALSYLGQRSYTYHEMGFIEKLGFLILRRLSSITVLLRKAAQANF